MAGPFSTRPNIKANMAQGEPERAGLVAEIRSVAGEPLRSFIKMYVLDVISDPSIITEEKRNYWTNVLNVELPPVVANYNVIPRNSIIAQRSNDGINTFNKPRLLFPMLPSHLAMPCKPGELVWVIFEDPEAGEKAIGYWLWRVTEPHFIDDVNHTHSPEQLDQSRIPGTKDRAQGKVKTTKELLNGVGALDENGELSVPTNSVVLIPPLFIDAETYFEDLVTKSDAAQMMQYEAIPRFKKRPGDVVLEGSNNTLIVLGTDRNGPVSDYIEALGEEDVPFPLDLPPGLVPETTENDLVGEAGSIDLVAGRGTLSETGGQITSTNYINGGEELKKELDKIQTVPKEGDPDFKEDRSRILISQRTKVDTNFTLNEYNTSLFEAPGIKDSNNGDAAIVIKSDKIRIIARSDISFIVTDHEIVDEGNGKLPFKSEVKDYSRWASITIKSDGSIIFTPSNSGYIKLGGDDADKAILCTDTNPVVQTNGSVSVPGGILNGDLAPVGTGGQFGTFATKLLVK